MTESMQKESLNEETKWYRRQLIVSPKIQYLIIFYAISLGVVMFAMGVLFTLTLQKMLILTDEGAAPIQIADLGVATLLIVVFWIWIYLGLNITNKVVGPIFRIIGEMQKIKGGQKLMKIAFRKKDFFSDLTYAYNDVIDQLNKNKVKEE